MIKEYVVKITNKVLPNAFTLFEDEYSPELEIVRCKDCKHQDPDRFDDGEGNYVCRKGHGWKPDDWFCADGERKEGR